MAYVETSEDFQDYGLMRCRAQYAAFLYDEYKQRKNVSHNRAVALAARKAGVTGELLRLFLPLHNRVKRALRNQKIIDMRASGYSINLIAQTLEIHRATVGRVLEAHKTRVNAAERYSALKIRGRLKYGDPRLSEESIFI